MRIRNRYLSIAWKVGILLCGLWGLLDGSGILAGQYTENFPHMFTNVSNLFAWLYYLAAVLWLLLGKDRGSGSCPAPNVKYTATISLLVTMLIAHFMLFDAMFRDGRLVWHLVIMHYVVPGMVLLDWLLFDEKGKMSPLGPWLWMSLVLLYLAVIMIGAGPLGMDLGGGTTVGVTRYPYTFLDPAISGAGGVAAFCGAMLAAFVFLGYVLFGADRLLAGRRRKGPAGS